MTARDLKTGNQDKPRNTRITRKPVPLLGGVKGGFASQTHCRGLGRAINWSAMHCQDIKRHLQPYSIFKRRKTTINHAFASAIAPCDSYDIERIKTAIRALGQDPEGELTCIYCDEPAETWDHVFATVKGSEFSGAGHRIGNLVPCCKPCNSRKGNKHWDEFLRASYPESRALDEKLALIRSYLERFFERDALPANLSAYAELLKIKSDIFSLMKKADAFATQIRLTANSNSAAPP